MNKNLFIKSTLILILSGFLTKILGFIIKVIYTRIIGEYGISLFTIATPTYSLLLTISTLAIPISISKLVSQGSAPDPIYPFGERQEVNPQEFSPLIFYLFYLFY